MEVRGECPEEQALGSHSGVLLMGALFSDNSLALYGDLHGSRGRPEDHDSLPFTDSRSSELATSGHSKDNQRTNDHRHRRRLLISTKTPGLGSPAPLLRGYLPLASRVRMWMAAT